MQARFRPITTRYLCNDEPTNVTEDERITSWEKQANSHSRKHWNAENIYQSSFPASLKRKSFRDITDWH